eukprot:484167-Amorphochlora_amoeboformis.AAC.2
MNSVEITKLFIRLYSSQGEHFSGVAKKSRYRVATQRRRPRLRLAPASLSPPSPRLPFSRGSTGEI